MQKKIRHIEAEPEPEAEKVELKPIPGLKFTKPLQDQSPEVTQSKCQNFTIQQLHKT